MRATLSFLGLFLISACTECEQAYEKGFYVRNRTGSAITLERKDYDFSKEEYVIKPLTVEPSEDFEWIITETGTTTHHWPGKFIPSGPAECSDQPEKNHFHQELSEETEAAYSICRSRNGIEVLPAGTPCPEGSHP